MPWRDRLAALRHVPALLRLVWGAHRGFAAGVAVLRLLRAGVPVLALWVGKLIVDAVVAAARTPGGDVGPLWRLVALEIAVVAGGELLARASALLESLLGDRFANVTSVRLMEHAATLDLAQFEDPAFYDQLERARRQTTGRVGLFAQLLGMGQDALTFASLAVSLAAFDARLLVLLAAAVLPGVLGEAHFAALGYSLLFRWTPERRQLDYLRMVGASDRTAKEVQLFGLAPWLVGRYRALADRFDADNRRLAVRRAGVGALLGLVGTAGYYGAYALVLVGAAAGAITVGTLTFLAGAFARGRDLLQRLLSGASDVAEQALYLRDLFAFFEMRPTITSPPGAPPLPARVRTGFVFEGVGFRYPGSDRWAVRGLDLTIAAGERVALVGENGAGKTTVTKLLARLYDPTEGRILLDGRDLREYDLASLRAGVGVIFQDFVRYDLPFDENIGVGQVEVLARANGAVAARDRARRPTGRSPRRCCRASRPATARCSAAASRTASTCRGASGRRWRSPAPTCATRSCSCSTSPPRRSTRAPSTRCSCASASWCAGGWPCSSRTASRPCAWPTASSSSAAAPPGGASRRRGRTRRCSPPAGCTRSCSSCRRRGTGRRPPPRQAPAPPAGGAPRRNASHGPASNAFAAPIARDRARCAARRAGSSR